VVGAAAAATKSGRPRTAGWVGLGERDGKAYARNRCAGAWRFHPASHAGSMARVGRRTVPSSQRVNDRPDPGLRHHLERPCEALRLDRDRTEILAKVRFVQTNIKQLVDNNAK
jgi:hypothetical protein